MDLLFLNHYLRGTRLIYGPGCHIILHTYMVEEAKFVSSYLSCPSRANPLFSFTSKRNKGWYNKLCKNKYSVYFFIPVNYIGDQQRPWKTQEPSFFHDASLRYIVK